MASSLPLTLTTDDKSTEQIQSKDHTTPALKLHNIHHKLKHYTACVQRDITICSTYTLKVNSTARSQYIKLMTKNNAK